MSYEDVKAGLPSSVLELDIDLKRGISLGLAEEKVEEVSRILGKDPQKLDDLYIAYIQAFRKTFIEEELIWTENLKKAAQEREAHSRRPTEFSDPDHEDFFETKKRRLFMLSDRVSAVSKRQWRFRLFKSEMEESFVRKLMSSYPKDSARIHEIIMKADYKTKESCRDLILRTVGRDSKTEYLFRGLPPKEKNQKTQKK
jgi:hypothetical protein